MPRAEQERVCDALDEMMRSGEYFRLASYHGWPSNFCTHNQEHFPAWHRGYCVEFEHALGDADRALGRDGQIGLPYWDGGQPVVNGEVFPAILRERFGELPAALREQVARHDAASGAEQLLSTGYAIHDDARIRVGIAPMASRYRQCLLEAEHWRHASNRWGGGTSLEDPHNTGHVALGFPMTSVRFAAFHPIFFMHHCQVDRVYESYLHLETDSEAEFAATQAMLLERNSETNRYLAPLEPFTHPRAGTQLLPSDCFDAASLGFRFDALLEPPAQTSQLLRERPSLVRLRHVTKKMVHFRSFQLHAFVVPEADASAFKPPGADVRAWVEHPAYGGTGAHFGGKGADCSNCLDISPFDIVIDVSDTVRRAGRPRSALAALVFAVAEDGTVSRAQDVGLPAPELAGPAFDSDELLVQGARGAEVAAAQRLLHRLGFARVCGAVDGELGPMTASAIKAYEIGHGLEPSGALSAELRASLLRTRFDAGTEVPGRSDSARVTPDGTPLGQAKRVPYHVSVSPGYLARARVLQEVDSAFRQWAEAAQIKLIRVADRVDALIRVEWADRSAHNELRFDGPGGALASVHVPSGGGAPWRITLDASERWILQGDREERPGSFALLPVVLHEVGHLIGLEHSDVTAEGAGDVMAPYYDATRTALSARDTARARALYSSRKL